MHEVRSRATHIRAIVSPYVRLCAAKQQQRCAACCGSGCLRLLRCRWLADKSTHQCFQHTEPPNKQKAVSSLERCALCALLNPRHEPLSESARRSPWLPPTAPVPLPRVACFISGSIEAIRHASISRSGSLCSPMHRSGWHGYANAIRPAASAHFSCRLHREALLSMSRNGRFARPRARLPLWLAPTASAALVGSLLVRWPLTRSTRTRGCRAGADCRERRCLFCLWGLATSFRQCQKSISRRWPLPTSAFPEVAVSGKRLPLRFARQ